MGTCFELQITIGFRLLTRFTRDLVSLGLDPCAATHLLLFIYLFHFFFTFRPPHLQFLFTIGQFDYLTTCTASLYSSMLLYAKFVVPLSEEIAVLSHNVDIVIYMKHVFMPGSRILIVSLCI